MNLEEKKVIYTKLIKKVVCCILQDKQTLTNVIFKFYGLKVLGTFSTPHANNNVASAFKKWNENA